MTPRPHTVSESLRNYPDNQISIPIAADIVVDIGTFLLSILDPSLFLIGTNFRLLFWPGE